MQRMRIGVRSPVRFGHIHIIIAALLQIGRNLIAMPTVVRLVGLCPDVTRIRCLGSSISPDINWIQNCTKAVSPEHTGRTVADQTVRARVVTNPELSVASLTPPPSGLAGRRIRQRTKRNSSSIIHPPRNTEHVQHDAALIKRNVIHRFVGYDAGSSSVKTPTLQVKA